MRLISGLCAKRWIVAAMLGVVFSAPAHAGFEFIPPTQDVLSAPALDATPLPPDTVMTPSPGSAPPAAPAAPVEKVVGNALQSAGPAATMPSGSPQPIMPQADVPRYSPAPAVTPAVYTPSSIAAPTPRAPSAPSFPGSAGVPSIDMHPLETAPGTGGAVQALELERAMLAGGALPSASAGRSSLGGMPLPPPRSAGYEEALGFGRDLPLALAVSQVVPPDYAFNFDNGVNPGKSVSWEGGRPWNHVLDDMLAGIGAHARIDDAKKEIAIMNGPEPVAAYAQPASSTSYYSPPAPSVTPVSAPLQPITSLDKAADYTAPRMQLAGFDQSGVLDPKAVRLWEAPRGSTLRSILSEWSMAAGVELFWSSDFDYPVESTIRITGTFEEAIQTLLNGLRDAQPRPIGRLHPNLPEGPSVLVIETRHMIE